MVTVKNVGDSVKASNYLASCVNCRLFEEDLAAYFHRSVKFVGNMCSYLRDSVCL